MKRLQTKDVLTIGASRHILAANMMCAGKSDDPENLFAETGVTLMHHNRPSARARAIAITRADEAAAARINMLRIVAIGVSAAAALIALPFFQIF